jgi:hypothetical protein
MNWAAGARRLRLWSILKPTTPSTPRRRRISVRNRRRSDSLTIESGGQTLKGADAAAALKGSTERGVTVGGDPEAREKAPGDLVDFLKPIFALAR